MKMNMKTMGWIVAIVMVLSLAANRPCAAQALTDLGVYNDAFYNLAIGINDSGLIVGDSLTFDDNYNFISWATIWQPGDTTPSALPALDGYAYSEPCPYTSRDPFNDLGQILGNCIEFVDFTRVSQACLWEQVAGEWTVTGLGILSGANYDFSESCGMNSSGVVVGFSGDSQGDAREGFIWDSTNGIQRFTDVPGPNAAIDTIIPNAGISDNGFVAGWVRTLYGGGDGGVIWDSVTGTSVTYLPHGQPMAISPSGLVTGYDYTTEPTPNFSLNIFLFLWSYNDGDPIEQNLGKPPLTPPAGLSASDLFNLSIYPRQINDSGWIVGYASAFWNGVSSATDVYWLWDGSQYIDLTTILPANTVAIGDLQATLNASNQVAIFVSYEDGTWSTYLWDGNPANEAVALDDLGGGSMLFGFNDAGQVFGGSLADDKKMHACAWGLSSSPPSSSLTISDVTVMARNSKVMTVTVLITNPGDTETAYDVTVTAASVDGVDSNSPLPLVYGAIKPGASKKCTLQFKNVPSGDQALTINGTSSLGDFFTTQTVTVP